MSLRGSPRLQSSYPLQRTLPFASQVMFSDAVLATDPDIGDDAILEYSIVRGDGVLLFDIVPLGPGQGFQVMKKAFVALNFEVNPTYTLVVQARDNGRSSTIGKECALAAPADCDQASAQCSPIDLRCHEICAPGTNYVAPGFFCQTPVSMTRESATVVIVISIFNANDRPFVVPSTSVIPTDQTNPSCVLTGSVTYQRVFGAHATDMPCIPQIDVWDDDARYPLVNNPALGQGGPFQFYAVPGDLFWDYFYFSNNRIMLVSNPDGLQIDQVLNGSFQVFDEAGCLFHV